MEVKPWFLKVEFWTALITALAIFMSSQVGIELEVEHIVGIVIVLVGYFWKKSKDEERALLERMLEKEIELEEAKLARVRLENR